VAQARLAHVLFGHAGQLHQPAVGHTELLATKQASGIVEQRGPGRRAVSSWSIICCNCVRNQGSMAVRVCASVHGHAQA